MFDALQRMNLTGHGIYEYRGPTGGTQVDLAVWADMVARIAGTVKGGEHSMDEDGRFFLHTPDGPIKVGSPLQETVDGCIAMRHAIRDATKYKHYVIGILFLPDMERDERLEQVARNHEGVYIIWGLDNLPQDLLLRHRCTLKASVWPGAAPLSGCHCRQGLPLQFLPAVWQTTCCLLRSLHKVQAGTPENADVVAVGDRGRVPQGKPSLCPESPKWRRRPPHMSIFWKEGGWPCNWPGGRNRAQGWRDTGFREHQGPGTAPSGAAFSFETGEKQRGNTNDLAGIPGRTASGPQAQGRGQGV